MKNVKTWAQTNVETHGVEDKVKLYQGDLLDALPQGSLPVHLIVSNPPYIGQLEIKTVDDQVKNHEPAIALFSGDHGTEIIERLIQQTPGYLLPGGSLIFETSPIVMEKCVNLVKSNPEFASVRIEKDFSGLPRIVIATKANG